jgi:hypothetical protein
VNMYAYLAGRFSARFALQGRRADLSRIGIGTTSRWLDLKHENESEALACAKIDVADIELADMLISFPTPSRSQPPSRGGFCWEQGYATAETEACGMGDFADLRAANRARHAEWYGDCSVK